MSSRAALRWLAVLGLVASMTDPAEARPKKKPPLTASQREADGLFKRGVQLYDEGKFADALAAFEEAYALAPHPLVLKNIAATHRELSHYAEAVRTFRRFLTEGEGQVDQARLDAARAELDTLLARAARVTVTIEGATGAQLVVDGEVLGAMPIEMPLILQPGEHRIEVRGGRRAHEAETIRVGSGEELAVALALAVAPDAEVRGVGLVPRASSQPRRFALGAGFGTNLRRASDSGAPSVGLGVALGRVELGLDIVLVAWAALPTVRVRLAGQTLSLHAVAAAPLAFKDGEAGDAFVAGAAGLGLRYRASDAVALRLESWISYAGKAHGTTAPAFIGGELWF